MENGTDLWRIVRYERGNDVVRIYNDSPPRPVFSANLRYLASYRTRGNERSCDDYGRRSHLSMVLREPFFRITILRFYAGGREKKKKIQASASTQSIAGDRGKKM